MTILEVAELAYRQLFPGSGDDTVITLEEVETTAVSEYAYQMLLMSYREKQEKGYYMPPAYLLDETEKEIVNGEIDISDLNVFKGLPDDAYVVDIYGSDNSCECKFIKSSLEANRILCQDDSIPESYYPYYIVGKRIKLRHIPPFKSVNVIFAGTNTSGINGDFEIDEAMAALVRRGLIELYAGKVGKNDETINDNETN